MLFVGFVAAHNFTCMAHQNVMENKWDLQLDGFIRDFLRNADGFFIPNPLIKLMFDFHSGFSGLVDKDMALHKGQSHLLDVGLWQTSSPDKSIRKKLFKLQHLRCGTGSLPWQETASLTFTYK